MNKKEVLKYINNALNAYFNDATSGEIVGWYNEDVKTLKLYTSAITLLNDLFNQLEAKEQAQEANNE